MARVFSSGREIELRESLFWVKERWASKSGRERPRVVEGSRARLMEVVKRTLPSVVMPSSMLERERRSRVSKSGLMSKVVARGLIQP